TRASAQPVLFDQPPPADLRVDGLTVPATAHTSGGVTVSWTVGNHGANATAGGWTDAAYLSTDGVWDVNDRLLGRVSSPGPLAAGANTTLSLQADLPPVTPGTYHVIVRTDIYNDVYEGANKGNNTT